jgi:hypothetical protein
LAVGLHIATALPNFLTYEDMQSDWSKDQPNPLRHDLVKEPIEIVADGYMASQTSQGWESNWTTRSLTNTPWPNG